MDPVYTALVAAATLIAKTVTTEAVKDAYAVLKKLLTPKLRSLASLEQDPENATIRNTVSSELASSQLAEDPAVLEKAHELLRAVEAQASKPNAAPGIRLEDIHAAQDVTIQRLSARGSVILNRLHAVSGSVDVRGIDAGVGAKK